MVDGANVWIPSAAAGAIRPSEVDVWRIGLIQPERVIQSYRELLDTNEVERADRFYFAKDRNRFTVARGVLRQLLGTSLKLDPREIRFVYGPQGKPSLAAPQSSSGLRFNLSHSGEVALVAMSHNLELGIDVEQVRADFASGEIATRFFSPEECAKLETLPAHESVDAFFNCWTRKEAYIKARGEGLFIPLDSFEVAFAPGEEPALLQVKSGDAMPSRWRFHALHPGPGYKAALAVEGSNHSLRLWEWTARPAADGHDLL
jgi:4'-phosphopantetheinyl transferase